MLWLEHYVTPLGRLGEARVSGRTLDQDGEDGRGGDVWFRRSWEGQDMAQNCDHQRKYVKSIDFFGLSKIPIPMTSTHRVINKTDRTAEPITGFPATGFKCASPSSPGTEPSLQLPWPLAFGPGATSPITDRLTHLGWALWSDITAGQQQLSASFPSKRITKMKAAVEESRLFRPLRRAGIQF